MEVGDFSSSSSPPKSHEGGLAVSVGKALPLPGLLAAGAAGVAAPPMALQGRQSHEGEGDSHLPVYESFQSFHSWWCASLTRQKGDRLEYR